MAERPPTRLRETRSAPMSPARARCQTASGSASAPRQGASSNFVGGTTAGLGNLIAFNTAAGVVVAGSSTNNAIWSNAIRDNGTLGIDLGADGLTANDAGDADEGGNDRVNFPVLTAAAGGVQGTLNSIPDTTFRIEFFGNVACDASGNGEGATFLGATTVGTDGTGNATIPLFTAAAGQFVTATATDSSNNTSEFSACVGVVGQTSPTTNYAAWSAGAPASLTTVDFEPFSTGTILTGTEYAGLGLTLTQRDGDPMRVAAAGDGSFVSAANLNSPTHGVSSSAVPGFPSGFDDTRSGELRFHVHQSPDVGGTLDWQPESRLQHGHGSVPG